MVRKDNQLSMSLDNIVSFLGYIFVAVALGAFVGYFLFGHLSMKTNMENLQAIRTKIICSTRCADSGKFQTFSFFPPVVSTREDFKERYSFSNEAQIKHAIFPLRAFHFSLK